MPTDVCRLPPPLEGDWDGKLEGGWDAGLLPSLYTRTWSEPFPPPFQSYLYAPMATVSPSADNEMEVPVQSSSTWRAT